jgi:D-arabinose 1-dehydrogenase-like Zn-dependent alcohol dehydrogenase
MTVYSMLTAAKAKSTTRVLLFGIGGLGYFAVMFAAALGAESTAISRRPEKDDDALKMSASRFLVSAEKTRATEHARSVEFMICSTLTSQCLSRNICRFLTFVENGPGWNC